MAEMPLDVGDAPAGVALIPAPIEVLGHHPELDDQVVREVLRLSLAPLLPPEAEQGGLVRAQDDPGVGAADEAAAISRFGSEGQASLPSIASAVCRTAPVTSEARSARMAIASGRSSLPRTFWAVSSRMTAV